MEADQKTRDATIRVGVAGWSYPDWRGVFYPAERPRAFSELRYAAERFDCLEVNSTFYRLPEARVSASWARQVADLSGFLFTAKLHRELTHGVIDREVDLAAVKSLCAQYKAGLEPLVAAERLGAVLLQFPWYFRDTEKNRRHLEMLAEHLQPLPLVVELRHGSFLASHPEGALPFLERLGMDFANIDLPRPSASLPPTCVNTGRIGYFRLHGRNRTTWFDSSAGRDRKYDYLYTSEELTDLLSSVRRLATRTETTYVVTNNHYRGQAPANAFQLIQMLGRLTPSIPGPLKAEYPVLAVGSAR